MKTSNENVRFNLNLGRKPMKTFARTFACAAVASILLVSCDDTSVPNASNGDDSNINVALTKQPYDPPLLVIADDVQKWLEESLASKGSEKRLIMVSDMYLPDIESAVGLSATRDSNGKVEYFLNGKEISAEKYTSIFVEYDRQRTDYGKRNLPIPGIISGEDSRMWIVLITAEEIDELSKKCDKLAIEFYIEPVNE